MAKTPDVVIVGAGGHARVLIDSLRCAGDTRSLCMLDADVSKVGDDVMGVPILGNDDLLDELARSGTTEFIIAVGGTRNNTPRARLFERALALGLKPVTIIHPRAVVSAHASTGSGSQILPGAIVNAGASLGTNVIVNSGAIVEHDCVIGDHVHIATGARLASTVRVGDYSHIGIGATVRQSVVIGASAVVGAGAVVVRDVSASTVVVGVPARELHE